MKNSKVAAGSFAAVLLASLLLGQQPAPPADGAPPAEQRLSEPQLDDLVAPIALYPDNLLSQILVASTYPLEVVEAQQWLQQNRSFAGQKLVDAAQRQNWDPSVQALVVFPDVLARLNQDIRWTTDLGNAFLAQQPDVMAAVQQLRARAQANGKLNSGPQENVTTQSQNGQSAIQIMPPDPGTVYVPNYNPEWVWGPPPYGYYPPLLYPPLGVGFGFFPGIDLGFYFGGGWGLWGGYGWGWGPNWFGGGIFLNAGFFHRFGFRDFHPGFGGSNVWAHDSAHRLGVPYANRAVANRFGGAAVGERAGVRANAAVRGGAEASRAGAGQAARAQSGQRFGTQGFERQNPGGNRSAFSGIRSGGETQMRSDHGVSSMGHAGVGGFGGSRGGGGGSHGGGRR
jgi:Protein of unknown function (DUF3300)